MELQNKHLTERIISAAIRVHKELGPGFLEAMYEEALAIELAAAGLTFERQKRLIARGTVAKFKSRPSSRFVAFK